MQLSTILYIFAAGAQTVAAQQGSSSCAPLTAMRFVASTCSDGPLANWCSDTCSNFKCTGGEVTGSVCLARPEGGCDVVCVYQD